MDTRTTDFQSALEWSNPKGLLRVGWDGSIFTNDNPTIVWDNPLRFYPRLRERVETGKTALRAVAG